MPNHLGSTPAPDPERPHPPPSAYPAWNLNYRPVSPAKPEHPGAEMRRWSEEPRPPTPENHSWPGPAQGSLCRRPPHTAAALHSRSPAACKCRSALFPIASPMLLRPLQRQGAAAYCPRHPETEPDHGQHSDWAESPAWWGHNYPALAVAAKRRTARSAPGRLILQRRPELKLSGESSPQRVLSTRFLVT